MRLRHYVAAAALGTWAGLWLTDAPADTAGPGDFRVVYLPPDVECGTPYAWPVDFSGLMQPKSTFVYEPRERLPPVILPTAPGEGGNHRPDPPRPPSPVPLPSTLLTLLSAVLSAAIVLRMTK